MLKSLISHTAISIVLLVSHYESTANAFSTTNTNGGRNRISPWTWTTTIAASTSPPPTTPYRTSTSRTSKRNLVLQLSSQNDSDNDKEKKSNKNRNDSRNDDETKEAASPLLSLPPIGESSFDLNSNMLSNDQPKEVGLVGSPKFELQYTCNVCETRNVHKVSRLAYTKGVVITVCKGCMSKHLIADNLGWSKFWGDYGFDGKTNIEEYMEKKGRGDEVNRVSKDVFHLEQVLDAGKGDGNSIVSSPIVDDVDAFE